MKFNKFYLFAFAALATMAVSCDNEDTITVGEQDSAAKPFVYFSDDNKTTYSIEPTADTEFSFTVCRRNAEAAAEVSLEVVENTDNVFVVPSTVSFAEGETEAEVTVSFADAPIGKSCTLTLGFGVESAGIYMQGTRQQSFTITRVKWNSLGMCTMDENYMFEATGMEYEILQRDDKPTVFRLMYPFSVFTNMKDNASEYIEITLLQPKDKVYDAEITQKNLVYFTPTNTGYFHSSYSAYIMMYHPGQFSSLCNESNFGHNRVLSYQEDGKTPGQIQLAPYYYMDGVGGWNATQEEGAVIITFPGFVPEYEADIETDFEYEEFYTGEFTSKLLGASSNATLYVGKCKETKDDCDKRFEEEYGKIFVLEAPYAKDYNFTFLVKKNKISLPEGEDYEMQPTGLTVFGKDVYATINPSDCSFSENQVVLNITFTDKTGDIVYGTYDETLSNIQWNSLGAGNYTDNFVGPLFSLDPVTYNVEVLERDDMPGLYRVMNPYSNSVYPYAEDDCAPEGLFLTIDATDPDAVLFEQQSLGFDWGYGEFNLISIGSYYMAYGGSSLATMKKNGYLGTLKDGVIEFPIPDGEGCSFLIIMGGKAYATGDESGKMLVLPTKAADAPAMIQANKSVEKVLSVSPYAEIANKINFSVRKEGKAPKASSFKMERNFQPAIF